MHTETPFHQAILREPEDDGLRLIYADWLEEQGDPRAEFIRIQLEQGHEALADARRAELLTRERTLLATHENAWLGNAGRSAEHWTWRRGFVDEVMLPTAAFLRVGGELLDEHPVRRVRLTGVTEVPTEALAACPHLGRVRELALPGADLGDTGLHLLLQSPQLVRLRALDISRNHLTLSGARELSAATELAALEILDLSHNDIADLGIQYLVSGPRARHYVELRLGFCGLSVAAVRQLVRASSLGGLQVLDLRHNQLGDPGVRALAEATGLPALRHLHLGGNGVGGLGALALMRSPHLIGLDVLDLGENAIGAGQREELRAKYGDRVRWAAGRPPTTS